MRWIEVSKPVPDSSHRRTSRHQNLKLYQNLGYSPYKTEKITDKIDLVYLEKVTRDLEKVTRE